MAIRPVAVRPIRPAPSRFDKSSTSKDPLSAITEALASAQGAQLIELIAAQLKAKKLIGQTETTAHDFDLSDGAREVMYVTCRMGPRQELVFKISPKTEMIRVVDRCCDTWRDSEGHRLIFSELFFYLPCNTKLEYYGWITAEMVSSHSEGWA